ncbi:MAG: hypothetical protein JWN94_4350 [Betaproteobacteria bacterium]|nr:hypothetical protein [Betaproteobacteria bacterium]
MFLLLVPLSRRPPTCWPLPFAEGDGVGALLEQALRIVAIGARIGKP